MLSNIFYFVADINLLVGHISYPLIIFYSCYLGEVLSVAGTAWLDVVFGANGGAIELWVLSFYEVLSSRFERSVFVCELEFVAFLKVRQECYFVSHTDVFLYAFLLQKLLASEMVITSCLRYFTQ